MEKKILVSIILCSIWAIGITAYHFQQAHVWKKALAQWEKTAVENAEKTEEYTALTTEIKQKEAELEACKKKQDELHPVMKRLYSTTNFILSREVFDVAEAFIKKRLPNPPRNVKFKDWTQHYEEISPNSFRITGIVPIRKAKGGIVEYYCDVSFYLSFNKKYWQSTSIDCTPQK